LKIEKSKDSLATGGFENDAVTVQLKEVVEHQGDLS
jgi:hypothetical protein